MFLSTGHLFIFLPWVHCHNLIGTVFNACEYVGFFEDFQSLIGNQCFVGPNKIPQDSHKFLKIP